MRGPFCGRRAAGVLELAARIAHRLRHRASVGETLDGEQRQDEVRPLSDTGSGITEEALPNVFEPWFRGTREARGLGLGLSIVRSLVAQLGGTAELQSEKGRGTTACVRIPVKLLDQAPKRPSAGNASLSNLRLLVVDDEDSVRNAVADLLRAKGAVCVEAPGAEEALREFEGQSYEAALIDIQMPGADGYELARRLKARHPRSETRLIAMSAFGLAQEHSGLFDAYVAKPAKAETMVGTIVRALERRGPAASHRT